MVGPGSPSYSRLWVIPPSMVLSPFTLYPSMGHEGIVYAGEQDFESMGVALGSLLFYEQGTTGSTRDLLLLCPSDTEPVWRVQQSYGGLISGDTPDFASILPTWDSLVRCTQLVGGSIELWSLADGTQLNAVALSASTGPVVVTSGGDIWVYTLNGGSLVRLFRVVDGLLTDMSESHAILRSGATFAGMFLNAAETRLWILDFKSGDTPEWQLRGYLLTDFSDIQSISVTLPSANYTARARAASHAQPALMLAQEPGS